MVDLTTLTDSEDEDTEKLLNFDPFKEKRAKEAAEDAKKTFLEVMGKGHMLTGFGAKGGGGSGSATASARTAAYRIANMKAVALRAAADPCFKAAVASQEPDSLNRKALQGNAFNIDDLAKAATQARPRGTGTPADSSIMIFSEGGKGLDLPGLFHSDISGKVKTLYLVSSLIQVSLRLHWYEGCTAKLFKICFTFSQLPSPIPDCRRHGKRRQDRGILRREGKEVRPSGLA